MNIDKWASAEAERLYPDEDVRILRVCADHAFRHLAERMLSEEATCAAGQRLRQLGQSNTEAEYWYDAIQVIEAALSVATESPESETGERS